MCLLIVAEKTFPEKLVLELGAKYNKDGMGMAWREDGKVKVLKGVKLTVDDLMKKGEETQAPWVIHFRASTAGGVNDDLCHPFSVDKRACTQTEFEADGVLAHNGVWTGWQNELDKLPMVLPEPNLWSDTRAMAYIGGLSNNEHLRHKFFKSCDEKLAYLTPTELTIFGKGWTHKDGGLHLSNDIFWKDECRTKTSNYRQVYGYSSYYDEDYEDADIAFESCNGDEEAYIQYWQQRGIGKFSKRSCFCSNSQTPLEKFEKCSVCKGKNSVEDLKKITKQINVADLTQDEWVLEVMASLERQGIKDRHAVHASRIILEEIESQEETFEAFMREHCDFYGGGDPD